jgi:hypothetical protein
MWWQWGPRWLSLWSEIPRVRWPAGTRTTETRLAQDAHAVSYPAATTASTRQGRTAHCWLCQGQDCSHLAVLPPPPSPRTRHSTNTEVSWSMRVSIPIKIDQLVCTRNTQTLLSVFFIKFHIVFSLKSENNGQYARRSHVPTWLVAEAPGYFYNNGYYSYLG